MRNRNIAKIFILAAISAGIFLVVRAESSAKKAACTESLEDCCKKDQGPKEGKMIWESLPQQFFSSI